MKLLAAGIALCLLSSAGAEAGSKLPKPIDSPIVRPKVRDDHKQGRRVGKHPQQYLRPEWGSVWKQTLDVRRHHEVPEYLKHQQ